MTNSRALFHRFDLDELERVAVRGYWNTYGEPTSDAERLFVQRGIDAMRFAVAKATARSPLREPWSDVPTAPIDRDRTEELMRCHDCGGATTIAGIVFEKHQGDYVLCATCTRRSEGC